jgi:hypothetical protein
VPRVEEWFGGGNQRLHEAAMKPAYRRAERSVHLNLQ